MASLKSLMKAKKESNRLSHPHARYSSSGQLSCTLCGTVLKSEAIWGSHLVSKQHRVNAQKAEREQLERQQKEEEAAQAAAAQKNGKRKSRSPSPSGESSSKRPRENSPPNNLPADFYTSSREQPVPSTSTAPVTAQEEEEDPSIDEFLSTLSAEPSTTANSASATISAAPVKFEFGAPKVRAEGEQNDDDEEGEGAGDERGETEDERRERSEKEEREEMMARLEEEEREQREADEKVSALKRRLELMRQAKKNKKA